MKRLPYLNYIGKDGTWNFKFFKWIKQHLHIKSFYGTSENAIYLQIWIAICTYLLLAYAKKVMHIDQSLHTISKNVGLFLTDKTPLNEYLTKLFQQKRRRIGYILAFSVPMISKRDSIDIICLNYFSFSFKTCSIIGAISKYLYCPSLPPKMTFSSFSAIFLYSMASLLFRSSFTG